MIRKINVCVLAAGCMLFPAASVFPAVSVADELKGMLQKVEQYVAEENYSKALEELSWAKKELESKQNAKLTSLLPDTLADFKGAKAETNSVMGLTTIARTYSSGANSFRLELQSGSGSGGAGIGGLAALGQMAAMFGQQAGQASMRINGRSATLQEENGELIVFLDGGSMLNIKKESGTVNLKSIAEAVDMDSIEKVIKGTK